MLTKAFGHNLARIRNGVPYREFAKKIGVSGTEYERYEKCRVSASLKKVAIYAEKLKVPTTDLLTINPEPSENTLEEVAGWSQVLGLEPRRFLDKLIIQHGQKVFEALRESSNSKKVEGFVRGVGGIVRDKLGQQGESREKSGQIHQRQAGHPQGTPRESGEATEAQDEEQSSSDT